MQLSGAVLIDAPRARVWSALNDPVVLAACIQGCEGVEVVSPVEKTARVMVKVGPVRARFAGRILLSDIVENERCALGFEGSGGAAGMARGESQVTLADEGAQTRLSYSVKASVAGKLGQVGGRMIDAAAKQMADQFFKAFQAQVAPDAQTTAHEAPNAPVAADGATPLANAAPVSRPAAPAAVRQPEAASDSATEWLRVKWFLLGVLATGLGAWIGSRL